MYGLSNKFILITINITDIGKEPDESMHSDHIGKMLDISWNIDGELPKKICS